MNPQMISAALCLRFSVPGEFGRRMLPFIQRVCAAPSAERERLFQALCLRFREESERLEESYAVAAEPDLDALESVARILHTWQPPSWFRSWSRDQGTG